MTFKIPMRFTSNVSKYVSLMCPFPNGTSWISLPSATSHYDYVCAEVSKGIASVSLETGIPVMFGVVTTDNIEQAIERAGTKAGNKGYDCALGAIEMINLAKQM